MAKLKEWYRANRRAARWLLGLGAALWLSGCVEREMVITSEPTGANVWVNGQWQGVTPYQLPFKHYGVFGVRLEKSGYYPLYVKEPLSAPIYQRIGPDLIAEAVVPTTIRDHRELHYVLQPVTDADEIADIMERCETMVARSEPMLERRSVYDRQRQEVDIPFLPEKNPQRHPRKKSTITPSEPRPATPLNELPPVAPLTSND